MSTETKTENIASDAQYLLFVSHANGGHTNTVHHDIQSLEAEMETLFENTKEGFDLNEVRKLNIHEDVWHELSDSSWFTVTKVTAVRVEEPKETEAFLVFSTDVWQSNSSYELEAVSSSIEEAREVVSRLFDAYGQEIKVVIKDTLLDENEFSDYEIYCHNDGLEWKSDRSDKEYGYLSQASEEEEGEDD